MEKTCSFTGHRKIENEHRAQLPALLDRAIEYAYREGCRTFCTGGAVGFDTEAARRVLLFRIAHPDIRLLLLLPCPEQSDRFSERQRDAYDFVLKNADEVVYAALTYTSTCMKLRNRMLAERGDILIAYLGHSHSGSSQTVAMAKRLGKAVYNLFPALSKKD